MTVASPDTPFLHPPDVRDAQGNGLYCFLQAERPCAADCMAYSSDPPEGPDYRGQQWAHCMLLVGAHRASKHLVILAQVTSELTDKSKRHAADMARSAQAPPPPVR